MHLNHSAITAAQAPPEESTALLTATTADKELLQTPFPARPCSSLARPVFMRVEAALRAKKNFNSDIQMNPICIVCF